MFIILIVIMLMLLMISKVSIKVINILDQTDVYIQIGVIKVNIDYDMFIKSVNKIKTNLSLDKIKKNIVYYKLSKSILNNSKVYIKEFDVIKKINSYNIGNIYQNIAYYSVGNYIKSFLSVNTYKQNNIEFRIKPSNIEEYDLNIDIEFKLYLFLKAILYNYKNILKIRKGNV